MSIQNTYRFFVPPESITADQVVLNDPALTHQIGRVLRLRPGDRVLLLDGAGSAYTVVLTAVGREQTIGWVEQQDAAGGEPTTRLTLYVALLRAERFEWVLQKGTELGASLFVPVICAHSLPAERVDARKLARWSRILREAAEQSCRGHLPTIIEPQSFINACAQAATAELAMLLWEGRAPHLRETLRTRAGLPPDSPPSADHRQPTTIALLSGPEGGITADELTTATEHGIIPVSLGSRILRAETAPIAAAAAIFYEFE
jgi:16S rRNA (uracil1498-N3)-methyltransferase